VGPRVLEDVEKRRIMILKGLEHRPIGRPARSQSLYRLRYPGSSTRDLKFQNCKQRLQDKVTGRVTGHEVDL
jgi:hypothetical protein